MVTRAIYYRDNSGTPEYPASDDVARFAEWASGYGHYRVARALMTLAVELADLEADDIATADLARAIRNVPIIKPQMMAERPRTDVTAVLPIYDQASDDLGDTARIELPQGVALDDAEYAAYLAANPPRPRPDIQTGTADIGPAQPQG